MKHSDEVFDDENDAWGHIRDRLAETLPDELAEAVANQFGVYCGMDGPLGEAVRGHVRQDPTLDDAWRWARSDNLAMATTGWRALVAAKQNEIVPDLIAALPGTLEGHHVVPPMIAIQGLRDAPESLMKPLWGILAGRIEPKAMQDFILAISAIGVTGIPSLVPWLMAKPSRLFKRLSSTN